MRWESAYRDLMDDIYFPGYAKQLIEEDPSHYQREYEAFIELYDDPQ